VASARPNSGVTAPRVLVSMLVARIAMAIVIA
jgi:hypothetical protein